METLCAIAFVCILIHLPLVFSEVYYLRAAAQYSDVSEPDGFFGKIPCISTLLCYTILTVGYYMIYQLNLVLVEPQIPQNTGNIARTCAVTGARLHLVHPLGFVIEDKKLKRAGLDYWDKLDITHYTDLEGFFRKNEGGSFFFFTTKGKTVHSAAVYPNGAYLIFGREDAGLPESLLRKHESSCVRIPMRPDLRSLNLSNSVAIAAYEALRQWDYPDLAREGSLTGQDLR